MLHGVAVSGALFAAYWTLIKQTKRVVVSISVVILYANNKNSAGTGDGVVKPACHPACCKGTSSGTRNGIHPFACSVIATRWWPNNKGEGVRVWYCCSF